MTERQIPACADFVYEVWIGGIVGDKYAGGGGRISYYEYAAKSSMWSGNVKIYHGSLVGFWQQLYDEKQTAFDATATFNGKWKGHTTLYCLNWGVIRHL